MTNNQQRDEWTEEMARGENIASAIYHWWRVGRPEKADELIKRCISAALEQLRKETLPHMCRMDHPEIRHKDSENEMCPLCVALSRLEQLRAEKDKALEQLRAAKDAEIAEWKTAFEEQAKVATDLDAKLSELKAVTRLCCGPASESTESWKRQYEAERQRAAALVEAAKPFAKKYDELLREDDIALSHGGIVPIDDQDRAELRAIAEALASYRSPKGGIEA